MEIILMTFSIIFVLIMFAIYMLIYAVCVFFSVYPPPFLHIILTILLTVIFFACLYRLSQSVRNLFLKRKKAFENIWEVLFYLFFFPPLALIYCAIFLLPFVIIIGLTNNILIGVGAFVLVVSLLIFTLYYYKQKNNINNYKR